MIYFVKIYFVGLLFLAGALIINGLAKWAKLPSWYDFLANPKVLELPLSHGSWLFVVYPFLLGVLVVLLKRLL